MATQPTGFYEKGQRSRFQYTFIDPYGSEPTISGSVYIRIANSDGDVVDKTEMTREGTTSIYYYDWSIPRTQRAGNHFINITYDDVDDIAGSWQETVQVIEATSFKGGGEGISGDIVERLKRIDSLLGSKEAGSMFSDVLVEIMSVGSMIPKLQENLVDSLEDNFITFNKGVYSKFDNSSEKIIKDIRDVKKISKTGFSDLNKKHDKLSKEVSVFNKSKVDIKKLINDYSKDVSKFSNIVNNNQKIIKDFIYDSLMQIDSNTGEKFKELSESNKLNSENMMTLFDSRLKNIKENVLVGNSSNKSGFSKLRTFMTEKNDENKKLTNMQGNEILDKFNTFEKSVNESVKENSLGVETKLLKEFVKLNCDLVELKDDLSQFSSSTKEQNEYFSSSFDKLKDDDVPEVVKRIMDLNSKYSILSSKVDNFKQDIKLSLDTKANQETMTSISDDVLTMDDGLKKKMMLIEDELVGFMSNMKNTMNNLHKETVSVLDDYNKSMNGGFSKLRKTNQINYLKNMKEKRDENESRSE